MIISEPILIDTNVLIYATDILSPFHILSQRVRDQGLVGSFVACITPQVLNEFFAVLTSSKRVQSPRLPEEAFREVEKYYDAESLLKVFPNEETFKYLGELFQTHTVSQQRIFDLYLIATMVSNNVTQICTYNLDHFLPYEQIEVFSPEALVAQLSA